MPKPKSIFAPPVPVLVEDPLTEVELDAVRQAAVRINAADADAEPWPDISDLAAIWQKEVRALLNMPNPRAEAWAAAERLIRAYPEKVYPDYFALSRLVHDFAWDEGSRQRFIQVALTFIPSLPAIREAPVAPSTT